MLSNLKQFIALYSAVILMMTGTGLLNSYIGLRLSMEGLPTQVTGLVFTTYFIGLIIGSLYCKRIIRNVGHIRAHAAFTAVSTAVAIMLGLSVVPVLWAALRFFSGIANMGLFMVVESWFNECAEPKARGRIFSFYMITNYLGSALGQKFLDFGDVTSQSLFLLSGLFLVLSIIPVATTRTIRPKLPKIEQISLKTIYKKAPMGMLGCFITGLNNSAFYSLGSVFAHQAGLSISQVSWFMALAIFGGLLFQWPIGIISDRFDRSRLLPLQGLILVCVSGIAALVGHHSLLGLLSIAAIFGGMLFTIYPVAVARAHDIFSARDVVKVSSALLFCMGVGAVFGPLVASTVMTLAGTPFGFFYYFIGTSSLYAVISVILRRIERVRIVPVEEQVDFVIMKKTSDVALHFDPRLENAKPPSDTET